jgi:RNA 2',3'-cyclic 3'-phosphodiesterase
LPPADVLPRLQQIAQVLLRKHGLSAKPIRPDRLHVTLHSLGTYETALPPELVDRAKTAAAGLLMAPFVLCFNKVLTFSGNKALVLRGDDHLSLPAGSPAALRQALGLALMQAGLRPQASQTTHMTLAYAERDVAEHPIEPLFWRAQNLVLIHSLRGQGEHRHLAHWPLRTPVRS